MDDRRWISLDHTRAGGNNGDRRCCLAVSYGSSVKVGTREANPAYDLFVMTGEEMQ